MKQSEFVYFRHSLQMRRFISPQCNYTQIPTPLSQMLSPDFMPASRLRAGKADREDACKNADGLH